MAEELYLERTTELKRTKPELEKDLNVKIRITGRKATIVGSSLDEYEASQVIDAISFGFSAKKALQLKDPDVLFRKIHIRDFTRRKNLKEVKARIIGKHGKTRKTLEEISDCDIILSDNTLGIIGEAESIEGTITALTNLIKGTKQSNVYRYLERMNKEKGEGSLGLK